MTVIRPNSISGVTSITALANEINVFRHNGVLAGLQLNGVNHHTSAGVSTFHTVNILGNLDVAGVLTYQDVTNVDSVGIITARQGIHIDDSITHIGDTDTKIRFPSADTFSVETAGSERLRITSTGQILIGAGAVATPKVTQAGSLDLDSGGISLCIGGNENSSGRTNSTNKLNRIVTPHYANAEEPMAMLSGYSSQNASELFYGGGSSLTNAATRHSFYTASNSTTTSGTERIRMVSNGQIIFGEANTSPVSDLEIRRANSGGDVSLRIGNNSGTNSGTTASLYFTTSPSQTFNTSYIQAVRDGGKLNFGYATNTPIVTMHVSQAKVGINQTAPQTGLHINQDWVSSYGSISAEGSANALVGLGLRSNGNYRGSLIWRDGSSGNYMDISTYGGDYPILFRPNGTEKVRINSSGDLGVLKIADNNTSSAGNHGFRFGSWGIQMRDTGGFNHWYIRRNYGGWQTSPQVTFKGNGYTGVNRLDPTHYLDVDGTSIFRDRIFSGTMSMKSIPFGANVTYDTGISINGYGYGGSILALCSRNYGAGTSTQAGLYYLEFKYDGNHVPTIHHVAGDSFVTFNKSASNTLTVHMGASNNNITMIESSVVNP